jgi:hypothetical protein
MKTQEWKFDDSRKRWMPETRDRKGPWDQEPDKRQWMSETGLPCLIVRNPYGALCGYVGVSRSHPWYGQNYEDVDSQLADEDEDYAVHGGLTFAGTCGEKICHEVEPGEDDDVWWLGFDTAHGFDLIPGMHLELYEDEAYRDVAYVIAECEKLAALALSCHGNSAGNYVNAL